MPRSFVPSAADRSTDSGRGAAALAVVALVASALLASAQAAPLRLVSTAWSPFTNEVGKPRLALDLVEAALGRVGITTTTTIVDAARFTPSLLASDFDGSAAAWRDAEREGALLFSQPYLENRLVLVGRRGTDVSASSLAALTGKRIAIVDGYSYGDATTAGPVFVGSRGEEDSLGLLLAGTADYALMDELIIQYLVEHYAKEAEARLHFGSKPLVTRELHLAIRRTRPDAESIISRFNAQLRGMIADRTYHRLLQVGWLRADIDDDGIEEYVPDSDRIGTSEPLRVYSLFSQTAPQPEPGFQERGIGTPRFYVGGNIYSTWATVPDTYKLSDTQQPNPSRSSASLFRFTW